MRGTWSLDEDAGKTLGECILKFVYLIFPLKGKNNEIRIKTIYLHVSVFHPNSITPAYTTAAPVGFLSHFHNGERFDCCARIIGTRCAEGLILPR